MVGQKRNFLVRALSVVAKVLFFLPAAVIVMLIRLIRPVIWIRFFPIAERIGHAAGDIDVYLLERKVSMHDARALDIFYSSPHRGNKQLMKMWSRVIPVFGFVHWLARVNHIIPGGQKHFQQVRIHQTRDLYCLTRNTKPQVYFNSEEEDRGKELLNAMGIAPGKPFVCFHGRDSVYLEKQYPGKDWSYHNYRDSTISNYFMAAENLVSRGYCVIRMGREVKDKFSSARPEIIDYANSSWRGDFADLYLTSKCFFFVGDGGIESVARLFRKPIVYVNFIPMKPVHGWSPDFLTIFKKLWFRKEKRFLTFREILQSALGVAYATKDYEQTGVDIVQSTPEEIRDVVLEKEARLRGTWQTNDDYEDLQRRFWNLYKPDEFNSAFYSRVGSEFLAQNRDLLI